MKAGDEDSSLVLEHQEERGDGDFGEGALVTEQNETHVGETVISNTNERPTN